MVRNVPTEDNVVSGEIDIVPLNRRCLSDPYAGPRTLSWARKRADSIDPLLNWSPVFKQ